MGISITGGVKVPQGKFSVGLAPQDGDFPVNAVNFDGTNDYLSRGADLTGAVDSKTGIFSCWVKRGADSATHQILVQQEIASTARQGFSIDDANVFKALLYNDAALLKVQVKSTGTILIADGWTHILAAWDLAVPRFDLYVDDVEDANVITINDDTIDYTRAEAGIGHVWVSSSPGTFKFNGCMADLYFQDGEFLDFTVTANRRKFIDALGKPADLGADGSTPTGTAPLVFQSGATDAWHTNKGSGGGFTETGALTDCASSPSD